MRKLPLPSVPEPESHHKVLSTRRPKLDKPEVLAALDERFKQYARVAPEFRELPPRGPALAPYLDALCGLYESTTEAAETIRNVVDSGRPKRCPYCGRPGTPATLDHILPRSKYQEFSLLAANLVPSCWECNHAKLTRVWDEETGTRHYLNPYYDQFLEGPFVQLEIRPEPNDGYDIPLFEFAFAWADATEAQVKTCEEHFRRLGVIRMLRQHCESELAALQRRVKSRMVREPLVAAQLQAELQDEEAGKTLAHGVNSWESIFLRSVAGNVALLEYLLAGRREPSKPRATEAVHPCS
jgi:5-methylcytosine-specific restriction endonuclease McrA